MMRQFELVELVKSYDPNADEGLLNRAYVYSMKAHGSQLRASGDPYFSHPIQVAGLLAQMKLDSASIVTGLLHDTIEDTVATLEDIERQFGPEVGRLVDGVTKLSRIELQSDQTKQAENFRKLVLAMSEDIRVLLVKLADRLHNMQTLRFIKSEDKRRRIARETMDIYAPLAAHRRPRPRAAAHRSADPYRRHARDRRARRRCALDLQTERGPHRRAPVSLAARALGHSRSRLGTGRIPRAHQARDVPGPGLRLHPEGRPDRIAARRDAGRLCLCGSLADR